MIAGRRLTFLAAVSLMIVQAALLADTALDKSDTADEPIHLAAAGSLWAHGDFKFNREAPVLPKWGFALAMRLIEPDLDDIPRSRELALDHVLWSRSPERIKAMLLAARGVTIAVTVLAGLLMHFMGLRFGRASGVIAHLLWCFSPNVLAFGSLAALDAWVAGMLVLGLWLVARYVEAPGVLRAAWVGVAMGLAAACKVTALGAVPVAAVVIYIAARARGFRFGRVVFVEACFLLGVPLALFTAYGFRSDVVDLSPLASIWGDAMRTRTPPLPFAGWIEGLIQQWSHGVVGHRSYLFGETRTTGWWWFFLAALALKTTVGVQLLACLFLASCLRRRPRGLSLLVDAGFLAYPVVLIAVMSAGHAQNGIRYILPAFPFGMIWAARQWSFLREGLGRRAIWLGGGALLASVVSCLSIHPHHLMFFNAWAGGPEGGPRYLIVGDDWAQDQKRLGEWQKKSGQPVIYYTAITPHPEIWGIRHWPPPCSSFPEHPGDVRPRRWIYALHAIEVHRPRRIAPGCLDWLTVEPPDERIGYSIYIYIVRKDRLDRLRANRFTDRPFWRSGPPRISEP